MKLEIRLSHEEGMVQHVGVAEERTFNPDA